jgi:hypothetical protein
MERVVRVVETTRELVRSRHNTAGSESRASTTQRAYAAAGASCANEGAEVDETETELPSPSHRKKARQSRVQVRVIPWPGPLGSDCQRPIKKADDIGINQRPPLTEGDSENGVRHISTDPRECEQLLLGCRDGSPVALNESGSQFRQATGPVHEAQRAQERFNLAEIGSCQGTRRRKTGHETRIDVFHNVGSRPLEKQLGDQDLVGVLRFAPGEASPVTAKPLENAPAEPHRVFDRPWRRLGHPMHCCPVQVQNGGLVLDSEAP